MFRESNNSSSKYISISYSEGYGLVYQFRDDNEKTPSSIVVENIPLPVWFRIKRYTNQFTIYTSSDGNTWDKVTQKKFEMSNNAMVGFFAVTGDKSTTCSSSFKNVSTTGILGGTDNILYNTGDIKIYPNPAKSCIIIDSPILKNSSYNLKIYDAMGKLMVDKETGNSEIDISSISSGIYIITISNRDLMVSKKLIIE